MLLVTGGAGFIGSNVVAALSDAGRADVAVCDLLGHDGKWRNLAKRQLAGPEVAQLDHGREHKPPAQRCPDHAPSSAIDAAPQNRAMARSVLARKRARVAAVETFMR